MAQPEVWKTFPPVRAFVTGHDANNVAKVLIDAPATNHKGAEGRSTLMWITAENPADNRIRESIEDMGARVVGTPPPAGRHAVLRDRLPAGQPSATCTAPRQSTTSSSSRARSRWTWTLRPVKLKARRYHGPARHQPRLGQPKRQEPRASPSCWSTPSRSASASRCWATPARAEQGGQR